MGPRTSFTDVNGRTFN